MNQAGSASPWKHLRQRAGWRRWKRLLFVPLSLGMHLVLTISAASALGVIASGCGNAKTEASGAEAFADWASHHAIPTQSLEAPPSADAREAIRAALGSARLVGLGESRHDTREQLLFKTLLIRQMVEELGFRALILEESYPHARALDRFVTTGAGDPREVLNQLAAWYLWDTEAMLEFVLWIRHFNEGRQARDQVRIFGADVTAPAPGVREVLATLAGAGHPSSLSAESLGLDLQQGDFWPTTWERYAAQSEGRRRELAANYDLLVDQVQAAEADLVAAPSPDTYARTLWMARVGRWGNALFSAPDREAGGAIREDGMAQTVLWILDHEMPDTRAILWAHNLHVARAPFRMPGLAEGDLEPMGVKLATEMGEAYIAVGATFGEGSYPADTPPGARSFERPDVEVMDGAMAAADIPRFLLDLRTVDPGSAEATWLGKDREWVAQDARAAMIPGAGFDLVYFVDRISRARLTPLARERFQSTGGP